MFDLQTKQHLKLGKPEAYKEVFRFLYPRLKGYCRLFIGDEDVIEDIIQESFITFWEKRQSIDPNKSVENLLFVILRNKCFNLLKSQKIQEDTLYFDNLNVAELQHLYQLDFTNKEEKSLEETLIDSFRKAVDDLPPKMKKTFVLCKLEGKKQQTVARELGISIKMVEKHIAKAKFRIREKLLIDYPALAVLVYILLN